jgi:hypothetical protein
MRVGADINRILKSNKKQSINRETQFEDHTDALIGSENIITFPTRLTKKSERTCGRRRYADFRVPLRELRANE